MRRNLLNRQAGFAPIWIILLLFLFGGFFVFAKNNNNLLNKPSQNQAANIPKSSPSPAATPKKQSLREICLEKIKDLPPPPHSYERKSTSGTLLPLYNKKRFPDEDKASACVISYDFFEVREKAFSDMGLTYYKFAKSINANLPNYPDLLVNFPKKVDSAYEQAMKLKGWDRTTQYGEKYGGLPYIVFYKEEEVYKMYVDVTLAGDNFMSMTLSVIGN